MDIYVARQPIFDRNMQVYGYELLYRKSKKNCYEGCDDNVSTASLIDSAFIDLNFNTITDGKKAFINFSEEMLFNSVPMLLPKNVVVEILETIKSTDRLLEVCINLKKNEYMLALDDFTYDCTYIPIIEQVDIIKLEFPITRIEEQKSLIKKYGGRVKFLAEKVETREDYKKALELGYDYFQGYFFSKPIIIKGVDAPIINGHLVRIMKELYAPEPDYQKISEIIETDVGLSYKLLKIANSVFFGTRNQIHSIKAALVHLGLDEIQKWIYLMMLKEFQSEENKILIKYSLTRAKMMELIAFATGKKNRHLEYFLTGLFSAIDILLNRKMEEIVEEIAITDFVKEALLNKQGEIGQILQFVIDYERGDWDSLENRWVLNYLNDEKLVDLYLEAIEWINKLE